MPFISRCCASQSATTSGESNGSGPECIERGVERDGGDFLPHAVLEPDDECLLDVEVDPVPRSPGAVDGETPLVVRQHRVQPAAVGPVRLETGSPEKLDHVAPSVVLAAHRGIAGDAPDDVAAEWGRDLLWVLAE